MDHACAALVRATKRWALPAHTTLNSGGPELHLSRRFQGAAFRLFFFEAARPKFGRLIPERRLVLIIHSQSDRASTESPKARISG